MKKNILLYCLLMLSFASFKLQAQSMLAPTDKQPNVSLSDSILNYGLSYLNTPYRYGSGGPNTFDCSGFTSFVFRHFGYNLEHDSRVQARETSSITKQDLQKGDLVFFEGRRRNGVVGHAGIILNVKPDGEFDFLHASINKGVTISSSDQPYYAARFIKGGRVFNCKNAPIVFAEKTPIQIEKSTPATIAPIQYHTVKRGETLKEIAQKYDVPISTLKRFNSLKNNRINAGLKLIVSEPEDENTTVPNTILANNQVPADPRTPPETQQKTEEPANNALSASTENQHIVQHGETLFLIAKKYGVTIEQLKELNQLNSNMLSSGQVLHIHANTTSAKQDKKPETANNTPQQTHQKTSPAYHKVQKGETLYSIAEKYHITLKQLKDGNQLESNNLTIGQRLTIPKAEINDQPKETESAYTPVTTEKKKNKTEKTKEKQVKHVVKKGENLYTISKKHRCTPAQLKKWNNLSDAPLQIGQKLVIRK